jgi:hypothetical protein
VQHNFTLGRVASPDSWQTPLITAPGGSNGSRHCRPAITPVEITRPIFDSFAVAPAADDVMTSTVVTAQHPLLGQPTADAARPLVVTGPDEATRAGATGPTASRKYDA